MKKCPSCQKNYDDDNLKFCQSDGTPLVAVAEEAEVDPYKTVVGNQSEISSALAEQDKKEEPKVEEKEEDPFQTMVAGNYPTPETPKAEPEEDFLEIPDEKEDDPMKTMVITGNTADNIKVNVPKEEPKDIPTPTVSNAESLPNPVRNDSVDAPSPELPQFTEPNVELPDFDDFNVPEKENVVEPKAESPQAFSPPVEPKQEDQPVEKETNEEPQTPTSSSIPIPSPFDQSMPPGYAPPDTPPFSPSNESFKPEPLNDPPKSPFANADDEPVINANTDDWQPPAAPMEEFNNKEIGQNTPFDSPVSDSKNQTLAIVSLVLGVLSMLCCFSIITGPAAIITGFMARGKASADPNQFGGETFAMIGMITGVLGVILFIILLILQFAGMLAGSF